MTPLHIAITKDYIEIVKVLLSVKNINVNAKYIQQIYFFFVTKILFFNEIPAKILCSFQLFLFLFHFIYHYSHRISDNLFKFDSKNKLFHEVTK